MTKYGGLPGGEEGGKVSYLWTHMICYIRDLFNTYRAMSEALEMTVSWSDLPNLIKTFHKAVENAAVSRGFNAKQIMAMSRVT